MNKIPVLGQKSLGLLVKFEVKFRRCYLFQNYCFFKLYFASIRMQNEQRDHTSKYVLSALQNNGQADVLRRSASSIAFV